MSPRLPASPFTFRNCPSTDSLPSLHRKVVRQPPANLILSEYLASPVYALASIMC
jgi:hypothetical protein